MMRKAATLCAIALTATSCASIGRSESEPVRVGPEKGALVVVGGGAIGPDILGQFVQLAGGRDARIVVIPTAGDADTYPADWPGLNGFKAAGAKSVAVLHTRDRKAADTDDFVEPLKNATGIWIPGGRQWRLVDSYLDTRTLREIKKVLDRGGVVGGTSAGASIQASYMVRGAREGNTIMMAPGYEEGFGLLRNTAVDQHLSQRQRERDMLEVVARHPRLLGIGLDESTAIVVRGDTAQVIGRGRVAVYNSEPNRPKDFVWLTPGTRLDLNRRVIIH